MNKDVKIGLVIFFIIILLAQVPFIFTSINERKELRELTEEVYSTRDRLENSIDDIQVMQPVITNADVRIYLETMSFRDYEELISPITKKHIEEEESKNG